MEVAATFTRDPAPRIEPPPFSPAGEVVIFALATEREITLEAGTALATETTLLADGPALAGNPTVPCALLDEPTLAPAGDPTVLYVLFSEPTLARALR